MSKNKIKSRKKDNNNTRENKKKSRKLVFLFLISAALLIFAAYAWFSATMNVQIKFFEMSVASDHGLTISLDGIEFGDSIIVSIDSILNDLTPRYPNHTNRWAIGGLWAVSSNGIRNSNMERFDMYYGEIPRVRPKTATEPEKRILHAMLLEEEGPTVSSSYLAFDFFLRNINGSPFPDNLYFNSDTYIGYAEDVDDDTKDAMQGIVNSLRFGIVRIGSVPLGSSVYDIQNIKCNNSCQSIIFEPNHTSHSNRSILKAKDYGITMVNGVAYPTYAVISDGEYLEHTNGHPGTGIPRDMSHFALQETYTTATLDTPICEIPNAITKFRAYFWIEGQDLDSLETHSKGVALNVWIGFIKDLAGYEREE